MLTCVVCSKDFYSALAENVDDCKIIFKDIGVILSQCTTPTVGNQQAQNDSMRTMDRLKWPFSTERVTLFRNDLDRLKLDVGLKIDVIRYKRELHESRLAQHQRNIAKKYCSVCLPMSLY